MWSHQAISQVLNKGRKVASTEIPFEVPLHVVLLACFLPRYSALPRGLILDLSEVVSA